VSFIDPPTVEEKPKWRLKAGDLCQRLLETSQVGRIDDGIKLILQNATDGTVEIWDSIKNVKWRFARPYRSSLSNYHPRSPSVRHAKTKKQILSLDLGRISSLL
jgi:hypothetical protein